MNREKRTLPSFPENKKEGKKTGNGIDGNKMVFQFGGISDLAFSPLIQIIYSCQDHKQDLPPKSN